MLGTGFLVCFNIIFILGWGCGLSGTFLKYYPNIPLPLVIVIWVIGAGLGHLIFRWLVRTEHWWLSIFDTDFKYLSDLKQRHTLNENQSIWRLAYKEYIRIHHPYLDWRYWKLLDNHPYFHWTYSELVDNLSIEVYENDILLREKDKVYIISDFESISELQCFNKTTTFKYKNYAVDLDIKVYGEFAEYLYDYLCNKRNTQ